MNALGQIHFLECRGQQVLLGDHDLLFQVVSL
jgi:hypothetical protein